MQVFNGMILRNFKGIGGCISPNTFKISIISQQKRESFFNFLLRLNYWPRLGGWQGSGQKFWLTSALGVRNAFFLLLIGLTTIAPPGLCPCWLIPDVESVHPHFSHAHAESPHKHDYLLQISQTTSAEIFPLVILSANLWIALAFAGLIWWKVRDTDVLEIGWSPTMPLEPPKWGL